MTFEVELAFLLLLSDALPLQLRGARIQADWFTVTVIESLRNSVLSAVKL